MLEASSQGSDVVAKPRAIAHEPISFKPNACAPASAGNPKNASASEYRVTR